MNTSDFEDELRPLKKRLSAVFAAAAAAILVGGLAYHHSYRRSIENDAADLLTSVRHYKTEQLAAWRADRINDTNSLVDSPVLSKVLNALAASPADTGLRATLQSRLEFYLKYNRYKSAFLVLEDGTVVVGAGRDKDPLPEETKTLLRRCAGSGRTLLGDIYIDPHGHHRMDVAAAAGKGGGRRLFLLLEIDAEDFLYPLIEKWPTNALSAETVLARADGDQVLFLGNLRHEEKAALRFLRPLTDVHLPVVQALKGAVGTVRSRDYRGVPVLASLGTIPDAGWALVTKIDLEEVQGRAGRESAFILLGTFALLLASAGIVYMMFRTQAAAYTRTLLSVTSGSEDYLINLKTLSDLANDMILLSDPDRRSLILVNRKTCETYGYTEEEMLRLKPEDMIPPEDIPAFNKRYRKFSAGESAVYTVTHMKKDGARFQIEVSATGIRQGGRDLVYFICRDITETRRAANITAARLRLMQFASAHTLDELLEETLNEAEKLTGSAIGFYHFVGEDQSHLTLQNWSTGTKSRFCRAEGKGMHYPVEKAGVWTECVRLRRPVIHNDYASLPNRKGLPPGHAELKRELVIPVFRGEKIVAILGVGNKASDYSLADQEAAAQLADLAWDIAVTKSADERLAQAAAEWGTTFDAMDDAVFLLGPDHSVKRANAAALKLMGKTAAEALGRRCWELVHGSAGPIPGCPVEAAQKSLRRETLESRLGGRDMELVADPVISKDGKYAGAVHILRDVTDRKAAESALLEREGLLRESQSIAGLGSYAFDIKGDTVRTSPILDELLGWGGEEHPKNFAGWTSLVHPDDRAMIQAYFAEEVIEKRRPFNKEYRILRPTDGATIWVQGLGRLTFAEDGTPLAMHGTIQDITERRRAREALQASEERFRLLFNKMEEGFATHEIVLDKDGRPADFIWLEVNPAFERHTGLGREQVIGRKASEVLPALEPDWVERFGKVALDGLPARFESYAAPLNRWLDVAAFSPARGQFAVTFTDITAQKKASLELERLNAEMRKNLRLYTLLAQINQAAAQTKEIKVLYARLCDAMVAAGGFRMAWVGAPDQDTGRVLPLCHSGAADGYLDHIKISVHDGPHSKGPTGRAAQTGRAARSQDIASDPDMAPWRDAAIKRGFRSSASVPIKNAGAVAAVLSLYADRPGFFDDVEMKLLDEIGDDLSLAVQAISTEEKHGSAQTALSRTAAHLTNVMEAMPVILFTLRYINGRFIPQWVSGSAATITGHDPEDLLSPSWFEEAVHPEDRARALQEMASVRTERKVAHDFRLAKKDGSGYVWVHSQLRLDPERPDEVSGSFTDITPLKESELRFKKLFEKSPLAGYAPSQAGRDEFYLLEPETGALTFASLGALKALGYTRDEALKLHAWDIMKEFGDLAGYRAAVAAVLARQKPLLVIDTEHTRKNGSVYPVQSRVQLLDSSGSATLLVLATEILEPGK